MTQYIIRRLIYSVFIIWGCATIVFFMLRLVPGDPVSAMLGIEYTPEAAAQLSPMNSCQAKQFSVGWSEMVESLGTVETICGTLNEHGHCGAPAAFTALFVSAAR